MTMALSCIMEGELPFDGKRILSLLQSPLSFIPFMLHRYAFSEDGGPTIIPKPDPYIPIGQRDGPSHLDLHKINTLYDCGKITYTHTDTVC